MQENIFAEIFSRVRKNLSHRLDSLRFNSFASEYIVASAEKI